MTEFSPRIELIMAAFQAVACHPEGWMPRLEKARCSFAAWRENDLLPSEREQLRDLDPLIPAVDAVLAASPAALRSARRELENALLAAARIFPKDSGSHHGVRGQRRARPKPASDQPELRFLRDPSSGETSTIAADGHSVGVHHE